MMEIKCGQFVETLSRGFGRVIAVGGDFDFVTISFGGIVKNVQLAKNHVRGNRYFHAGDSTWYLLSHRV